MDGKTLITKLKQKGLSKWRISKIVNVHWNTVNHWDKGAFQPTPDKKEILINLLNEKTA
jgi:DNA-binding transcriptional regulator YiaG